MLDSTPRAASPLCRIFSEATRNKFSLLRIALPGSREFREIDSRRALPMSTRVWPLSSLRKGAADGSPNGPRMESGGFLLLEADRTRAKRLLPALQSPCAHFESG